MMKKPVLLIPGISGLLGLNLALCARSKWDVVGTTNTHSLISDSFHSFPWNLNKPGEARRLIEMTTPALVINCAAIANLETAEQEPTLAWKLNANLPGEFAQICNELQIPFIQLSTDAVFDGVKGNYSEIDTPNPINTYAKTKLAGEEAVMAANSNAIIARVNFYGWSLSGSRSLCEFFYNHLRDGKAVNGFRDLMYNPMMVSDLAETLLEMSERRFRGLYHVSVNEQLSKYDFGCRLAREFGFDSSLVKPVSWRELGFRADRSPDLTLSVNKLISELGHPVAGVDEGLRRLSDQLTSGTADEIRQMA